MSDEHDSIDPVSSMPDPEAPTFDALELQQSLARVQESLFGQASTKLTIGRFIVKERLGAGAMGIVYAAADEQLGRRVAIKVLRAEHADDTSETKKTRLLREAQTLAQLSHPNVVTVHEVGEHEGRLFIAMEFVDGPTLGTWLRAERRSSEQILDTFIAAGRGLEAVHDSGLIHRDFKPDNVLMHPSGRPLVADFGLARIVDEVDPDLFSSKIRVTQDHRITHTGVLVGTPAYMAPELFAGQPASAHSDQFSFCVALFEALHGQRPFNGETPQALWHAATERVPVPTPHTIPAPIRRILIRGLKPDPLERYPSMGALLRDLERVRAHPGKRWTALAALGIIGGAILAAWLGNPAPCDAKHELTAIWNREAEHRITSALASSGHPRHQEITPIVIDRLHRFTDDWVDARDAVCRAKEQSGQLRDQRILCLERARYALSSSLERLQHPSREAAARAASVIPDKTIIERCSERELLQASMQDQTEIATIHALEDARTLYASGALEPALERLTWASDQAESEQNTALLAEISMDLSNLYNSSGNQEAQETALLNAIQAAERSHRDHLRVRALAALARHYAPEPNQQPQARLLATLAEAAGRRLDDALTPRERATLELTWGDVASGAEQFETSEEHYRTALHHLKATDDSDPSFMLLKGLIHSSLGYLAHQQESTQNALQHYKEGLRLYSAAASPSHPDNAALWNSIGALQVEMQHLDEGESALRRALEIRLGFMNDDDPRLLPLYQNLGVLAHYRGDPLEAERVLSLGLQIAANAKDTSPARLSAMQTNLGAIYRSLGRPQDALELHQKAEELRTQYAGPQAITTAHAQVGAAMALTDLGRYQDALDKTNSALAIYEKNLSPQAKSLGVALVTRAQAKHHLERNNEALDDIQRALQIAEATSEFSTDEWVDLNFGLAQIHAALHHAADAQAFADLALEQAASLPQKAQKITTWLEQNQDLRGSPPTPAASR